MSVQDKYKGLIDFAGKPRVENLSVTEQNGVLHISGNTDSATKDKLWKMYNDIDPDMRAGDLVLNIQSTGSDDEVYEIKSGDSLSKIAQNYPGMTWQKIYEANKDTIKDPNVIYPGKKIRIPL